MQYKFKHVNERRILPVVEIEGQSANPFSYDNSNIIGAYCPLYSFQAPQNHISQNEVKVKSDKFNGKPHRQNRNLKP